MSAIDLIGLMVPVTYFVMLGIESLWPARRFPPRKGWRWTGVGFLVLVGTIGTVVPLCFDPAWLARHRWLDGSALGVAGGTLVGWIVLSGAAYVYHRATHTVPLLWRLSHQLHHSPQRVDISGSVLFHPLEMVVQLLIQLSVTLIVLGLNPLAAALVAYIQAFYGMFQHLNVHTPQWLGYLIQRPEAHCVHHRLGHHSYNYGDLPLWDLLLGTFRNPRQFNGDCGFEAPQDRRLLAMLCFRDVNVANYGPGSRGSKRMPDAPANATLSL